MGGEVKSMRMAGALVFVGILAAGCGPTHGGPPVTADYKLYEAVSSNKSPLVSVIDTRSHASERSLPLGVPSGDWKHLYSIVGGSPVSFSCRRRRSQECLGAPHRTDGGWWSSHTRARRTAFRPRPTCC